MIEVEKTHLAKFLPKDLFKYDFVEIVDLYIPKFSKHPNLRIRKIGDKYKITRKIKINELDVSEQKEMTISLTKAEFQVFEKLPSKKIRKLRYFYNFE